MGPPLACVMPKKQEFQWTAEIQSSFDSIKNMSDSATPLVHPRSGSYKAQKNYNIFDCDLSTMSASVKHFGYFIEGHPFHIYTDYKPLIFWP